MIKKNTKIVCYEKGQPVPINRSLIFLIQKVKRQLQIVMKCRIKILCTRERQFQTPFEKEIK